MKKFFQAALSGAMLVSCLGLMPSVCQAEIVEGRAVIENGDLARARTEARNDAMRSYVEQKVGVHISSSTTTNLNMVVSDYINARSDGYVQIQKVVREWQQGGIFCVRLDLEAGRSPIETAVRDVKRKLQEIDDSTSRSGIVVAISGFDEQGAADQDLVVLNNQVVQKLKCEAGFKSVVSEEARRYLDRNPHMDSYAAQAEVRKIAKNARFNNDGVEATAILRGLLNTRQVTRQEDCYVAVVEASFELVGLDSDLNDVYSDYVSCTGASRIEAVRKAQKKITSRAVMELGRQSLETLQRENRGAMARRRQVVKISGITDRAGQLLQVSNALKNAGCNVGRCAFDAAGTLNLLVESGPEADLMTIMLQLGLQPGTGENNFFF